MKLTINQKDYSIPKPQFNKFLKHGIVSFDRDNLYLERLLSIVNESPTQSAILKNMVNYMYGLGLTDYQNNNVLPPNLTDTWDELIKACMTDYTYFNAFALEIIPNADGKHFSFYHIPVMQVRCGQYNERNKIDTYYLSADWTVNSWMSKRVTEIKAWGSESPKAGTPYLMYCREYQPDQYYYAIPEWVSALNWIMADGKISTFTNNFISNNMSAGKVLSFPNDIDDARKQELYDALAECFGSEKNAGATLVLFGEDGVLPTIENLESKDADMYLDVNDMVVHALCTANRVTSPKLLGIHDANGFSSQAEEIIAAYAVYMDTVIIPKRVFVLTIFNNLLVMNGCKRTFLINDLNIVNDINGEDTVNDAKEMEAVQVDDDALSEDAEARMKQDGAIIEDDETKEKENEVKKEEVKDVEVNE